MTEFRPTIAQYAFGNACGRYELGDLGEACFRSIMNAIWYAYWNREQEQWDERSDPNIPGMTWRSYWWGDDCSCKDGTCPSCLPNFECEGARIRWYKYPMRGMSIEQEMTPDQWAALLPKVLEIVRASDPAIGL